jgi:hypothetical protein
VHPWRRPAGRAIIAGHSNASSSSSLRKNRFEAPNDNPTLPPANPLQFGHGGDAVENRSRRKLHKHKASPGHSRVVSIDVRWFFII